MFQVNIYSNMKSMIYRLYLYVFIKIASHLVIQMHGWKKHMWVLAESRNYPHIDVTSID